MSGQFLTTTCFTFTTSHFCLLPPPAMRSLAVIGFICMLLPKATWANLANSSMSEWRSFTSDLQQFVGSLAGQLTCYTCDPPLCYNYRKQTCPSDYEYCLSASAAILNQQPILKTCATKTMCDASVLLGIAVGKVKCCQEYLCNGAESFTLSFLLMFIPLLSSVLA